MTRTEHIQSVFEKYSTDKATHGYAEFYAQHLPENPRSILEIGVKEGASIRAWKELFPTATIMGMDLFREFPFPDIAGVQFTKANQCDWLALERLRGFNFEVIIDDGSHNWRDQIITFYGLAHEGCNYFIEDTHCCNDESYAQGLPGKFCAPAVFDAYGFGNHWIDEFHNGSNSQMIFIKC